MCIRSDHGGEFENHAFDFQSAWIDLQMIRADATIESVLREFTTRFTGSLRDWFESLGQYRQSV